MWELVIVDSKISVIKHKNAEIYRKAELNKLIHMCVLIILAQVNLLSLPHVFLAASVSRGNCSHGP